MTISGVAVLGAGGGGRASALMLARAGLSVRLWEHPRFASNLSDLPGSIFGDDEPERVLALEAVTTDLPAAVEGAQLIVACVQRGMHEELGRELARLLTPDQALLLNPGSFGGALEISRLFREEHRETPLLGETATLTHCARPVPGGVRTGLLVQCVFCAALPASRTAELIGVLQHATEDYRYLRPAQSVLETGLYNGNPVLHPAIALLNAANIERSEGSFRFYGDGMSPAVARLIERVDEERQRLAAAYGITLIPEPVLSKLQGYADTDDTLRCYRDSEVFAPLLAPNTLDHRYMHEDVGEGLVTWLALAEVAGVSLPLVESLVRIAEAVTGQEYLSRRQARLMRLGLEGLTREEILEYVLRA